MDDCHTFQLVSADGTKLFARHWDATGARATLLFIHGFGEHSGRYAPFGQHLADNGVDVFAVDLRGHGRSEGKRGVIRDYGDFRADLAALIEHVRARSPAGPVVLFGHSMGGGIVLDHGFSPDPLVRGVIASAPLIAPAEPIPGLLRAVVKTVAALAPAASMRNAITGEQISTVPAERAAYEQDPLNHDRLGLRTAVAIIENGEAVAAKAGQWSLPLLIYHAREDQLTQFDASERFAQAATGAEFRAFSKVQHEMHNDTTRAAIYRAVLDFIGTLS